MKLKLFTPVLIGLMLLSCNSNNEKLVKSNDMRSMDAVSSDNPNYSSNYEVVDFDDEIVTLNDIQRDRLKELSIGNTQPLSQYIGSCSPINIKNGINIKIGNADVTIKRDTPIKINGLEITTNETNSIFEVLIAYDIASKNLCKIIGKQPRSRTKADRDFLLELTDRQTKLFELYTNMKIAIASASSNDQLLEIVKQFQSDIISSK